MGIIDTLRAEGALVLHMDFRAGHCRDLSGQGNHGTPRDVVWGRDGAEFTQGTSLITIPDSNELQLTEGALIAFSAQKFWGKATNQFLIAKRDGGGTNYELYLTGLTNTIAMYDGAVSKHSTTAVVGKSYVAANMKNGEACEGFIDGVSDGDFSGTSSISADDADLLIGNYTSDNRCIGIISAVLIVNRKLTATEHSQLYAELAAMTWPSKSVARAKAAYGPELLTDGDMEAAGTTAWAAAYSAILTKEAGEPLGGTQVLRIEYGGIESPDARQSVIPAYSRVRITGWARSDGTATPAVSIVGTGTSEWSGTTSTDWQKIDVIVDAADNPTIYFKATGASGAGEYVEFDNVSVKEVYTPEVQWKTDWGTPVTETRSAGNYVGPFEIQSGTFKVTTDTINGETAKVIECVTAGVVSIPVSQMGLSPSQAAYGTWDWWAYKTDAGAMDIGLVCQAAVAPAAGDYGIALAADESLTLREPGGSAIVTGAITADAWQHLKATRTDQAGLWGVEVEGVSQGTGAEATIISGTHIAIDMDAGCKVVLDDLSGDHAFVKKQGVE